MIQIYSNMTVADNTGARVLEVIRVHAGAHRRYAQIGDTVTAVVKEAVPNGTAKKSEVVHAVVVRQRKRFRRADGSYVRFDDNAAVLVSKPAKGAREVRGTRIFGPVPRELRERGFQKIISLAPEVL
ncbi:MAG: 50S ribosomal protein L14 [Candidatus Andersenbacteria bacterium]